MKICVQVSVWIGICISLGQMPEKVTVESRGRCMFNLLGSHERAFLLNEVTKQCIHFRKFGLVFFFFHKSVEIGYWMRRMISHKNICWKCALIKYTLRTGKNLT